MKTRTILFVAAAGVGLTPLTLFAATRASANYSLTTETIDAGGRHSASAAYANEGSLGGIAGVSTGGIPVTLVKHGYIGQLYEPATLEITTSPLNLDEGTSRQLAATLMLDDSSVLVLPPGEVQWSIVSGPIESISPAGLATAQIVYQDMPATVRGTYQSSSDTLDLTVLNVGIDDYGIYAGDSIDDAWQVAYFGVDNPVAGPAFDPDADGQSNFFEYVAGTSPVDPDSRFRLAIARVPSVETNKNLVFSPRYPSRTYSAHYELDPVSGVLLPLTDTAISDNGPERTITDLYATNAGRYYRVRITYP